MTTNSSHVNSCWICDVLTNNSKRINIDKLSKYLNNGYKKGRCKLKKYKKNKNKKIVIPDFKGSVWIHNNTLKINKRVFKDKLNEYLNNGWELKMVRYGK